MLVNKDSGEIYLYGPIGEDFFEEGITDRLVIEALSAIGDRPAVVRINSPGGVADQGISIYNALRRHKPGVTTVVDSLAASAASVIAMAGDKRITSKGGRWMIHQALTFAIGNANDMREIASVLDAYDKSLVDIYEEGTGLAAEEIFAAMQRETWYTADEAVEAGLANEINEAIEEPEAVAATWFANAPAAFLANATKVVEKPKARVKRIAARARLRVV